MTVSSEVSRSGPYNGNGATTVFAYTFKIFAAADLLVTEVDLDGVETPLVLNTDYTVDGVLAAGGGNVTLTTAPVGDGTDAGSHKLTIRRVLDATQTMDLRSQGKISAEVLERAADRAVMLIQQLQDENARSLRLIESEAGSEILTLLPALADRKGRQLTFDPLTGQPTASSPTSAAVSAAMAGVVASSTLALGRYALDVSGSLAINVKDYPYLAKGDGTTDDTTAVQAAINASANGAVFFPAGRYRVTASLTLPLEGVRLFGSGNKRSIIVNDSAAGIAVIKADNQAAYNDGWVIEDLGIITKHTADIGVDLSAVSRASLSRIRVWGDEDQIVPTGTGVLLDALANSCYGNTLIDCDLRALNKCVHIRGGANTNFAFGGQWTLADSVVYQSGSGATRVENCAFFGVRMEALAGKCVHLTGEVWSWLFSGCRMETYSAGGIGVKIDGGSAALPATKFDTCLITASGGSTEFDLSTAVGRVLLSGNDVNEYSEVSGSGAQVIGKNIKVGNPGDTDARIDAIGSGADADLQLYPKGDGKVLLPQVRLDASDIAVNANGVAITMSKATHTLNGNGGARTNCTLAAGTAGQMVSLIGYTWAVQLVNGTTADLIGGAANLGNGAGQAAGLTLVYSSVTGKWQELSRATR